MDSRASGDHPRCALTEGIARRANAAFETVFTIVIVAIISFRSPASPSKARRALFASPNTPNTVEPLPDRRALVAPRSDRARRSLRSSPRRDSAAGSRSFRSGPPPESESRRLVWAAESVNAGAENARKPLPWKGKTAERRGRATPRGRREEASRISPRPVPRARPPSRKNGTSEPSWAARAMQIGVGRGQIPERGEAPQRRSRIRTASAKPTADGDFLGKVNAGAGAHREPLAERVRGAEDQIAFVGRKLRPFDRERDLAACRPLHLLRKTACRSDPPSGIWCRARGSRRVSSRAPAASGSPSRTPRRRESFRSRHAGGTCSSSGQDE